MLGRSLRHISGAHRVRVGRRQPAFPLTKCSMRCITNAAEHLLFSSEVQAALDDNRPVVALESTIISHGMPYPQNYTTAKRVEDIVRENGCTPATIAIINGAIHVGLEDEHLEVLAKTGQAATKCSRRDIPTVIASGATASTTVASTMIISNMAGLDVFVTGGIGGVHRDGETTMDISADLSELSKTPVAVVSAGVKSILDIPLTLEYLETMGVPVVTLGAENFPAFFSPDCGVKAPSRVDDVDEAAKIMFAIKELGLQNGMVLAVPNPFPADSQVIEDAIQTALKTAQNKGIRGKEMTPFMLEAVNTLTGGKSLEANIALIENNARVGSQMAVKLKNLEVNDHETVTLPSSTSLSPDVIVFGGAVVDVVGSALSSIDVIAGSSNPGLISQSFGGVGRNVAEGIARLGSKVALVAAVGSDEPGHAVLQHTSKCGVDVSNVVQVDGGRTATYMAIHDSNGDLLCGLADMDINSEITPKTLAPIGNVLSTSKICVTDANLSDDAFAAIIKACSSHGVPVAFEPTSDHKAVQPVRLGLLASIALLKPNWSELCVMFRAAAEAHTPLFVPPPNFDELQCTAVEDVDSENIEKVARGFYTGISRLRKLLEPSQSPELQGGLQLVVSLGPKGVYWVGPDESKDFEVWSRFLKLRDVDEHPIENSSGAGDSLFAGIVHGVASGSSMADSIEVGLLAAHSSMRSHAPVAQNLR